MNVLQVTCMAVADYVPQMSQAADQTAFAGLHDSALCVQKLPPPSTQHACSTPCMCASHDAGMPSVQADTQGVLRRQAG